MDGDINRSDFPAGTFNFFLSDVTLDLLLGRADIQRVTIMKRKSFSTRLQNPISMYVIKSEYE